MITLARVKMPHVAAGIADRCEIQLDEVLIMFDKLEDITEWM